MTAPRDDDTRTRLAEALLWKVAAVDPTVVIGYRAANHLAATLLPVVEAIAAERAAEALDEAATTYAEAWPGIDPVTVDLCNRAAALRAASRGENGA